MDKDDSFTILDVQLNSLLGTAEGVVSVTSRARVEIDDMTILWSIGLTALSQVLRELSCWFQR